MIVVTGATGFLGSVLVKKLLALGKPVRALKRPSSVIPPHLAGLPVNWFDADVADTFSLEEAFEGAQQVYHCAALVSFYAEDKKKMFDANIRGTANVVNACLQQQTGKLLHVSSVAALGETKAGELITEKTAWDYQAKRSAYAISKHESEMEVWRGIAEGLNAVIVNPSLILGKETANRGSGKMFEAIQKGLNYYTMGSCGFVHADDVTQCMIALMDGHYRAERYIISAENWNYRDLLYEIASCFGLNLPPREARPWMLNAARIGMGIASVITGRKNKLSADTVLSAFKKHRYDNQKIKQAIGIDFKPVDETIKEVCKALTAGTG